MSVISLLPLSLILSAVPISWNALDTSPVRVKKLERGPATSLSLLAGANTGCLALLDLPDAGAGVGAGAAGAGADAATGGFAADTGAEVEVVAVVVAEVVVGFLRV